MSLVLTVSTLGSQWAVDGQPVRDGAAQKVLDGFGASLVLVPRAIDVIEVYESAPAGQVPTLPVIDRVASEEAFAAVVLFGGCRQDPAQGCKIEVDYWVYAPDESLYVRDDGREAWTGAVAEEKTTLVADRYLRLSFNQDDPAGVYRIVARVRDVSGKLELTLERTVTLEQQRTPTGARPN